MTCSLRALTCAALLATAFPALANSDAPALSESSNTTDVSAKQEGLQERRAEYEAQRDRISGADKLPERTPKSNSFFHAPVDTRDAPEQTSKRAAR